MLKHLRFLILLVLPFSFAAALTSCSDDDEVGETSALVGSWAWEDDFEKGVWIFNSDGSCVYYDYVKDPLYPSDKYVLTGNYHYDSSNAILLITWYDQEEDETLVEKYKVTISSSELVLEQLDIQGTEIYTLKREP